jgi:hypothetical protein
MAIILIAKLLGQNIPSADPIMVGFKNQLRFLALSNYLTVLLIPF